MLAVHLTAPGPLPVVRDYRADELETTEVPDVRTLNAFGTGQVDQIYGRPSELSRLFP